jgi:N-acetylmuramoyl-L-alanine amidase
MPNTSQFDDLKSPSTLVLCAGHGGGDSGATNGNFTEADETIYLVNQMVTLLQNKGVNVTIVPHELGLVESINWVNQRYQWGDAWVIEIHRDSADGVDFTEASNRCGVYGFGAYDNQPEDADSMDIARFMRDVLVREGASDSSWARPDTDVRFGRLGWIRDTVPLAHLMELGFMQGDNSNAHLNELAQWASAAVYEAFTGQSYDQPTPPPTPPPSKWRNPFDVSAEKAQNTPAIWNNQYINQSIKDAVTKTKDITFLLNEIINRSASRDQLRTQYNKLQQDYQNLLNGKGGTPSVDNTQLITNIQLLIQQIQKLISSNNSSQLKTAQLISSPAENSSLKSFFSSKKVWITLLSNLLSFGIIIIQTVQIQPQDDWRTICVKLISSALAALGISQVANQYVKVQGEIDNTATKMQNNDLINTMQP